ncbi:regulator [Streptomyces sp. BB1-1-1]|uniref:ATP-binding protein n=1 Tax=Streptomyces sp. BB1-1-1 TaxID=3074430 RepID=UPI0028777314|nr:regulator [Streptomyces sp. BB1-1-1]WND33083.1 regulator [Streptomyces sp. BB1-1-1]
MLSNLPETPTGFVGRASELARLDEALRECRLVTLTGVGGVGKSRLALHAADRVGGGGRAVAWADLWPLPDDRLLTATVADALDFSDHTAIDPVDALGAWLTDQAPLLVLDSCEHVTSSCRDLVRRLLDASPGLTVLATSREPLGLGGERVVEVEPLPADTDAVRLLRHRAAALDVPLDGAEDLVAAARLCRWLQGIPLAVELVAGQLVDRGIGAVEEALLSHLDIAADRSTGPPRHRAVRTTVGWSHELCTPPERLLWARLSVFRGPVDADTVLAVCGGGPLTPPLLTSALRGLERKSVLTRRGERCRMLDTVREYGRMWLDELNETHVVSERHARFFLDRAREADAGWLGPDQMRWYRWTEATHADLCAALDHFLTTRSGAAVELSGLLGFLWSCCGHLPEAADYLEDALSLPGAPNPARVRALWALGVTHVLRGDVQSARHLADACGRAAEDADGRLRSAYLMGLAHLLTGRPMAAGHAADLALAQAAGVTAPGTVMCRLVRVFALTGQGFLDRAREEAESLRAECAALGEWWTRSYTDYQLALIALFEDRATHAVTHARSMLEGKRHIGDGFGLALGLDVLAAALAAEGAAEPAAAAYAIGETLWSSVGHPQRGTPELGPVRVHYESTVRSLLGDERYETVLLQSAGRGPDAVLAELLGPAAQE